jgi:hypothetical protein
LEEEGREARAYQVQLYRMEEGRYNEQHRERLRKLSKMRGFTGDITPGEGLSGERSIPSATMPARAPTPIPVQPSTLVAPEAQPAEGIVTAEQLELLGEPAGYEGDDESDDDEDEEIAAAFERVLDLTGDPGAGVKEAATEVEELEPAVEPVES